MFKDTVAAISTPLGRGGVGIVRISGDNSLTILRKIFTPARPKRFKDIKSHTVYYGWIKDEGNVLDEVLVLVMKAPRTYTREDIVEISCHGGPLVLKRILELVLKKGARLAQPGEFTLRAFLNGRLDLTQAEAVLDIINASTQAGLDLGLRQLRGDTARFIEDLRGRLIGVLSQLEARLEFPEDVQGEIPLLRMRSVVESILNDIREVMEGYRGTRFLKEGLRVCIVGKTNVGKSSLMNRLLDEERNIVSSREGTTRDIIEEEILVEGYLLRIIDTAGFIEAKDEVEEEAMRKTQRVAEESDLILFMVDSSSPLDHRDMMFREIIGKDKSILVINKIDLPSRVNLEGFEGNFLDKIYISCKEKKGLGELKHKIIERAFVVLPVKEPPVHSQRHIELLQKTSQALGNFLEGLKEGVLEDLLMGRLKEAQEYLDRILGKIYSQDMLESIFSQFCIGK